MTKCMGLCMKVHLHTRHAAIGYKKTHVRHTGVIMSGFESAVVFSVEINGFFAL